jgi:hypothetical protein
VSCLNLVANAVVAWNTVYTSAVIEQLRAEATPSTTAMLAASRRARFEHINPYGKYTFDLALALRCAPLRRAQEASLPVTPKIDCFGSVAPGTHMQRIAERRTTHAEVALELAVSLRQVKRMYARFKRMYARFNRMYARFKRVGPRISPGGGRRTIVLTAIAKCFRAIRMPAESGLRRYPLPNPQMFEEPAPALETANGFHYPLWRGLRSHVV